MIFLYILTRYVGIALGYLWAWMIDVFGDRPSLTFWMSDEDTIVTLELVEDDSNVDSGTKNKPKQKRKKHDTPSNAKESADVVEVATTSTNGERKKGTIAGVTGNPLWIMVIRLALSGWAIKQMIPYAKDFQSTSHR